MRRAYTEGRGQRLPGVRRSKNQSTTRLRHEEWWPPLAENGYPRRQRPAAALLRASRKLAAEERDISSRPAIPKAVAIRLWGLLRCHIMLAARWPQAPTMPAISAVIAGQRRSMPRPYHRMSATLRRRQFQSRAPRQHYSVRAKIHDP